MKKIKLNVEDLVVTSMKMEENADGTGTVHAASDGSNDECWTHSCRSICVPWWMTGTC